MDPFPALADPVRRDLLRALAAGPARVIDLARAQPISRPAISRPAISRHLRVLTAAGLATAEDRGRERHYALNPAGLGPVQGLVQELLTPPAAPFAELALDGLALEVHRTVRDRRLPSRPVISSPESAIETEEPA